MPKLIQAALRFGTIALLVGPAVLAEGPAAAEEAGPVETVEVTGTRIRNTDAASSNPITVVSGEDIAKTEAVTVEQILGKLPAIDFTGGVTSASNNGTTNAGASNASLRNLGPQRTLVLVNGFRFPYTDIAGSSRDAVDLGGIDAAIIDRVEVLRDGASSVYGADAVGGVINIITRQHFDGVEAGGSVGMSSYGDGLRYNVFSTLGADFDRGTAMLSASDSHQDLVPNTARSWATDQYPGAGYNSYANVNSKGLLGSSTTIGSKSYFFGAGGPASGILAANVASLGHPIDPQGIAYAGGAIPPGDLAIPSKGGVFYNLLPPLALTVGYDEQQASANLHYDVVPGVGAVLEGFYTDRQSNQLAAAGAVGGNPTPQFPALYIAGVLPDGQANPYNPTNPANPAYAIVNPTASRALTNINVPFVGRQISASAKQENQDVQTYRIRAGLEGTAWGRFDWQAGYLYALSSGRFTITNQTNLYHAAQELGMLPCGNTPGCSLGNFLGDNTLTPAQAAYLQFNSIETSNYQQQTGYGDISGPIYDLPAGPLKAAFGVEYRTDGLNDTPSPVVVAGDGNSYAQPSSASYGTASADAEFNIPLLKDLPFIQALIANVSGRYDDNTKFGSALTYKLGLDYAVTEDFRLRGSNGTGFRAPQLRELYGGFALTSASGSDPCQSGGADAGNAQCRAALALAGATTAGLPHVKTLLDYTGGNPALRPENSIQWSYGGVFTPHGVPDLSVAVDFYAIKLRDEITTLDPNQLLAACYGGVRYLVSQAQACTLTGFSHRTKSTGALGVIETIDGNINDDTTKGIDIDVAYAIDTAKLGLPAWGRLNLNGSANYLLENNVSSDGTTIQQAGTFNATGSEPRWKALARLQFARDDWSFGWSTRYYGGIRNQNAASACEFGTVACPVKGAFDFEGNEAAGVFYHDIEASYQTGKILVSVGVDNLFDKDPPFLSPADQGTALGLAGYDFIGRFVYLKTRIAF